MDGRNRVVVVLPDVEYERLQQAAAEAVREPAQQATYLVREALNGRCPAGVIMTHGARGGTAVPDAPR
jgi:hypothetical protein